MPINNYLTFSNTGDISGGLKVLWKAKTFRVFSRDATIVTDLAGNRTRLSGAESGKVIWQFTALVKRNPDSGFAPLGNPLSVGQSIYKWAHPSTAAEGLLKMTDPGGTTWDVLWKSTWTRPTGLSNDVLSDTREYYEVPVEVWQI